MISYLALLFLCLSLLFVAYGCKGKSGGSFGRDADKEYEELVNSSYSDIDEACGVARDYLDYFSQRFRNDSHYDDVRLILLKFKEIRSIVYNNEGSFADFVNETSNLVRVLGKCISDAEERTSFQMLDYSYLETTGDVPEK